MAVLYITELDSLVTPGEGGNAQIGRLPAIAEQTVAITAGSVLSATLNSKTKFVRLAADAVCSIGYDGTKTPTASATTMRMSAEAPEYFGVIPGSKIAVITNA